MRTCARCTPRWLRSWQDRVWLWSLVCIAACASPARRPDVDPSARAAPDTDSVWQSVPSADAWPDASARFRQAGAWLGADGAYSVALGPTRILWLFADSFIDPRADGSRENGPNQFIRNSVAIQSGPDAQVARDLSRSTLSFHWRKNDPSTAHSFFSDIDTPERWLWPLHGVLLPDGKLLLFRMHVTRIQGAFGFALDAWDAVAVDDPARAPDQWQPRNVAGATRSFGKLIGCSVLIYGDFLYAYAVENQAQDHAVFLVRWPLAKLLGVAQGALDNPAWYTSQGFESEAELLQHGTPAALFTDGQVEFSVHFDARSGRFVQVQITGLFLNDPHTQLSVRTAPQPEGPWSDAQPFYRPAESTLANAADLAVYAGKVHPEQEPENIITYVVNDVTKATPGDALYYPQVLRVCPGAAGCRRDATQH